MKHGILISILICFLNHAYGQNSSIFFFDEFNISLNRTALRNNNTKDRFGFGLGAYHSFMAEKKVNIIFGIEYNRTSQYKKYMYEGHFTYTTDLIYNVNFISIPAGLRINTGPGKKVFLETGGFADLIIHSNRTGIMHTYLPDENNQTIYSETQIDKKAGLSNSFGFFLGIGIRIPISKFELVIKPDYKFGINELYSYQDDILNRYFRINVGLRI